MSGMSVIGIGCVLMKDDGIGVRVAESIEGILGKKGIRVTAAGTDFEYGLSVLVDGGSVIVLDAFFSGKKPGDITCLRLKTAYDSIKQRYSQHEYCFLEHAFRAFEDVKGLFIGIEAGEIGCGLELSNALRKRYPSICRKVIRKILKYNRELFNV